MASRQATAAEIKEWERVKKRQNIKSGECTIQPCQGAQHERSVMCSVHRKEFMDQRDHGYWDFRLWAIWKLEPTKGILGTFFVEISTLLHDYDEYESVFGLKVRELMEEYYEAMNK